MKRLKFKIAGVMLGSMIVLFLAFILIFRYSFNRYYSKLAVNAVRSEIDFVNSFNMDDDSMADEYLDNNDVMFTEYIRYLLTDETMKEVDKEGAEFYGITDQQAGRILECARLNRKKLDSGEIIEINEWDEHLVMGLIDYRDREEWAEEEYKLAIVYVDVQPIRNISYKFSRAALIALAFVGILMGIIGILMGRQIEEERARQTTFFQNASHELKTPLMSIQGYAEGIQTGVVNPKRAADVIMDESQRMADLVQEILDISLIESSRITLNPEEIDLRELLYDALRSIEPLAGSRGIRLDVNFPEERIEIKGDEVQLRKAVVNLFSNALRHAQSYIETACSAENKSVLITVANDGTPLDKEMQKRVFERFYSGPDGSTGIGLALTKDIVELHRGTICAKGKDGRTVFEIRLPK